MFISTGRLLGLVLIWILTVGVIYVKGRVDERVALVGADPVLQVPATLRPPYDESLPPKLTQPWDQALVHRDKQVSHVLNVDLGTARKISRAAQEVVGIHEALSFWLVIGVIDVESGGDPCAVSSAGAIGLMQIMPRTGEEIARDLGIPWDGPHMLCDIEVNIHMGSYYLAQQIRRFGDLKVALAAYNWGPGHIRGRLMRGRALPVIYPHKVLAAATADRRKL